MLVIIDADHDIDCFGIPENRETGLVIIGACPFSTVMFLKNIARILDPTKRFSISAGNCFKDTFPVLTEITDLNINTRWD
jgi:hypothetical protein